MAYAPVGTLPTFNQLVKFSSDYKETVPENIVGDLAESWEVSPEGTEITFKLHQEVKWHDGTPFTAEDVLYSLDKINDVNRSAISGWFPAYESTKKIDDHTVKVHLTYPSASFMLSLASSYSQIQANHLAGIDDQSAEFMVGTGPFILEDFKVRVHLKWKRNPDYFKKDKYDNQLPYLEGIDFYQSNIANLNDMLLGRRIDIRSPFIGSTSSSSYNLLRDGAPELLWQKKYNDYGAAMYLNLNHQPLNDIRVRRAMGLVLDQESLIIGYAHDPMFGIPGQGLLNTSQGLPQEETAKLMGWDKPYAERVTEAKKLMAEAGYLNGFKLTMLGTGSSASYAGANIVFADTLRKTLNINSEVIPGLSGMEIQNRLDEGAYDLYNKALTVGLDPAQLVTYFGTDGYDNNSHYSNPELDRILAELDRIIDPDKRREAIWEIERILLTDLPALPTGIFVPSFKSYYPHVKNPRWTDQKYSDICQFEDVWMDESLRIK